MEVRIAHFSYFCISFFTYRASKFWHLSCEYEGPDPEFPNDDAKKLSCTFSWDRIRIFDRLLCIVFLDICVEEESGGVATVTEYDTQDVINCRPNPLNTIDLQNRAYRFFGMGSEETMTIAEELYHRGILSYPYTETNFFKDGFELDRLIEEHRDHSLWGAFAYSLLNDGNFLRPVNDGLDDQSHHPIHPTKRVEHNELTDRENLIYELVCIHFLASCSKNAIGTQTDIVIEIPVNGESFKATGLMVLEKNWMEVYAKYENWTINRVPILNVGDTFVAKSIQMIESSTEDIVDFSYKSGKDTWLGITLTINFEFIIS